MSAPIRLEGVAKRFGPVLAVQGVTFTVREGEVFALIGPSGSGKSSTLRLIAGFERPDRGTIAIGDRTVAGPGASVPPERRGVGMVFQDYALFPHLTVAENVAFGLHRVPRAERARRVEQVLALVGLASFGHRYPHQLSGGQQQRVALARALAPAPAVILLDEPLSNLDADLRDQTRRELARILRVTGSTAVFVTHDQQEAFVLADRVAILAAGRIEQVGTPEEVYERPATRFVADFVGEADFLPASVHGPALVTELGTLPNPGLPSGTLAELMLRPDDLEIVPDPGGELEVVERQYRGEEIACAIRLPSGRVIHSHLRHTDCQPGLRVRPLLHLKTVVAFPAAESAAQHVGRSSAGFSAAVAHVLGRRGTEARSA